MILGEWPVNDRKKLFRDIQFYYYEEPELFHLRVVQVYRRCVLEEEQWSVSNFCHSSFCGGHYASIITPIKVLQSGFFWPTLFKEAFKFCYSCVQCQFVVNIKKNDMMPLQPIIQVEIFDLWGLIS